MIRTSDFLVRLRRRPWAVALLVALGAGAGLGASALETPVYAATTQLLVDTRLSSTGDFDTNLQNTQLLSQYFIAKATSRTVTEAVAADRGIPISGLDRLSSQVSVQVLKGTDLIVVTATSTSPAEATLLANGVASHTIALNKQEVDQRLASQRTYLDGEIERLDGLIKAEQDALSRLQVGSGPNADGTLAGAISSHQARLTVLQNQYSDTYHQRQSLQARQDVLGDALSVSEPATPPIRPIRPVPPLYIGGGLLLGLLLGVMLTLLLDRIDGRIHSPDALADATGTPVAVTVDFSRPGGQARILAAYSAAWASVLSQNPEARTLMLVGAAESDSAAESANGVAAAAGRSNRAVVVFGGGEERADPDTVAAEMDRNQPEPVQSTDGTLALPIGHPTWDPRDGDADGKSYDLVVTSVPTPTSHPVAMALAARTDAAIVVATAGSTRLEDARETAELLRMSGVPLVASILIQNGRKSGILRERRRSA